MPDLRARSRRYGLSQLKPARGFSQGFKLAEVSNTIYTGQKGTGPISTKLTIIRIVKIIVPST